MHVDVSDILREGEGHQADFTISGENPVLEGIERTQPISGDIRIIGTKAGVIAAGTLVTTIMLECDRCLRAFTHDMKFRLNAEFSDQPAEDQFPIDKYGGIDLAEPIRQEIEVHTPLRRLCQDDCKGIELKHKKDT